MPEPRLHPRRRLAPPVHRPESRARARGGLLFGLGCGVLGVVLWVDGCADPGCSGAARMCLDHETVRDCTSSPVVEVWCPAACRDAGASVFFSCREAAADPCGCTDEPIAPLPCEAGITECLDERTLLRCVPQAGLDTGSIWEATDCVARCLSLGALTGICAQPPPEVRLGEILSSPGCFCDANGLEGPRG